MNELASPAWPQIEAVFIERRTRPHGVQTACAVALKAIGADAGPELRAGLDDVAGFAAQIVARPAYHDQYHFAEATMVMGWLCASARAAGLLDADSAACGVIAMAGHDLLHDGSVGTDGALEARAAAAVDQLLGAAGVDARARQRVGRIILATDPRQASGNAAALEVTPYDPDALLAVLANEADLAASLMPTLGPRLGALLATEWRNAGAAGAAAVETHAGRLAFLRNVAELSRWGNAIGLATARDTCFCAYAALGCTMAAGAARLDALSPAEAGIAYATAISTVGGRHRPMSRAAVG